MSNVLGQRILLARRELGIKQSDLSQRAGVSATYISEIERGKSTNVTVDVVYKLADALGVTPGYLLGITSDTVVFKDALQENSADDNEQLQGIIDLMRELAPEDQRLIREVAQRLAKPETSAFIQIASGNG
jgi:transcriptional regulator with XRE-family HTH domain